MNEEYFQPRPEDWADAREMTRSYYAWAGRSAEKDFLLHLERGVLVNESGLVLMARPVFSRDFRAHIINPEYSYDEKGCDAWFIHFMAGNPLLVPRFVPDYARFPLAGFIRGGRLRNRPAFYPVERTLRLACQGRSICHNNNDSNQ